ncbi:Type III restriction-modification enzyme, R/helicase subunit [Mycobacteroides abscessus subsp. abscessus]|uniref:DEAD/DEAH box helicase family protein n=3 Tax=Mycobacteriaceae TaxID=1762 RepID=UPI00092A19B6|nr:DEAD/DEAH box helicase family protein [Mycobacteroides abscessus]SIA40636.1 Type III restriction-modification enzyme, R/helicase subunit [Mycobacteroides abscessus subsp. abscessus]SID30168.1 Type III restriction-modification enzyme, R/helicase subunit [Mycobacteroides abscessus subsp. abscessus]SKQ48956.1 Type III restriction-modification enzyme, R/helicase subunit [Mycobacteroides abscessus subsp. abscessus]
MSGFADFPLAKGLSAVVNPLIPGIVDGTGSALLDEVTPVTSELLRFWFQQDYCDTRELNFHAGQRAAILNIIYAHEVLGAARLRDLYEAVAPEAMLEGGVLGEVMRERHDHPKYAAKMATGTGKTWVLNALLIWQHLNKVATPQDHRFSSNFLLVAPGLIVYDRLLDSFMGKEREGERDFTTSDVYLQQGLFVPDTYRTPLFSFLQSSVVTKAEIGRKVTGSGMVAITNWHLLAGQEDPDFVDDGDTIVAPGAEVDAKAAVESFFPLTPGTSAGNALDILDRRFLRGGPLQALKDLPDLVVFNDEAHHIHEVRKADEVTDVEWQKSLSEIASTKGRRFTQIDFSATPYNEVGAGKSKGKAYFPHIVVDFDLNAAMRAGLVKSLALDKRKEIAALPLDFKAERDEQKRVTGLSNGQRVMLQAGLKKLQILEEQFAPVDPAKHPKLLVICEDTNVSPHVVEYLQSTGLSDDDILRVDSGRKAELGAKDWVPIREKLFDVDRHKQPKVIVSVLMLREGFDVSNIAVIVPLRSSQASILLEQTVGRGLRLMWRGDPSIDELKAETRERIRNGLEPTNYFDVLFIVEHPAFSDFYDELLRGGLMVETGDESDTTAVAGDLEHVDLRPGYQAFDFEIPIILRDADEELRQPSIDPLALSPSPFPLELLLKSIGKGDRFVSHDAQTGTQYGDYRVDGGVLTATGYNDYLSRMTTRITEALGRTMTKSQSKYNENAKFPILQAYRPLLTGWLDTYIRNRVFDREFDPLADENWRVLLLDDVAHGIAGTFATKLVELQASQVVASAEVQHRALSDVTTIPVRGSTAEDVNKCIYPKLPVASQGGGLERRFIRWADKDSGVEALAKLHEYRHDFMRRPYLKADGMPAQYSPDFLIRTADSVYVVETKAQSALSDENVRRKQKAAVAWCDQINELPEEERDGRQWAYVLLGESAVIEWQQKNATVIDLLEYAKLRRVTTAGQDRLL